MADELAETFANEQASRTGATSKFAGKKLKILSLLLVVVAAQVGLIYFLVPAPVESASGAETEDHALGGHEAGEAASQTDTVEVVIDDFNVTNNKASTSSVIHITFKLVAIVSRAAEHDFKTAANELHRARVRQAIVIVARSCSLADLDDPHLVSLKRQIREEINKVLRKSAVIEVVINDFKTMEQ